jgi:two-component system chemotaxis sensor kinase CheA
MDELDLFREDSEEQLQSMENALVEANENGVDEEIIGAVFRAMHTIKGSAGMFGFDNIVSFTHVAENLMSEVRNGKVELDSELVSLFFDVKDHVENLIELEASSSSLEGEDLERNNFLIDKLTKRLPENSLVTETSTNKSEKIEVQENSDNTIWHLSIRLRDDFFESGMDILSIFSFLNSMGEMVINVPIISDIPKLEDTHPTKAYIGFEIDFMTDVDKDMIEEAFEFILDDIFLTLFRHNDEKAVKEFLEHLEKDVVKTLVDEGLFDIEVPHEEKVEKNIQEEKTDIPKIKEEHITPPSSHNNKNKKTTKNFSLRVESTKVDYLMNQISEMVIANAKVVQMAETKEDNELEEASAILTHLLEEIRNSVMSIRMVPVEDSFIKFKRIVGDVAKKLGKDIDFIITGGDTELDKSVIEKINDPLVHMLRNSIDHGVEMPDVRASKGKNPKGRVELKTYPDAGTIVIEIIDDGAGLDTEKLLQKAIDKGIIDRDANLTDKEIFALIFHAGFSTAQEVSDISGRGVGMDVVRRNIEDLRGKIDIESTLNKGTKFTIRLPLTLAIIDGFLVQVGSSKFVIPLDMIQECIELTKDYKEKMKGNNFINLRGEILPIFDVRNYFDESESDYSRENIVVVRYANYHIGLLVDELFGEYHTVIKPLGDVFSNVAGISGGSILGSGEVALIFDIPALIDYYIKQQRS